MRGFLNILLSGAQQPLKGWVTLVYRVNKDVSVATYSSGISSWNPSKGMAYTVNVRKRNDGIRNYAEYGTTPNTELGQVPISDVKIYYPKMPKWSRLVRFKL